MKLLYLSMLFTLCLAPPVYFADPVDRVGELIRQGNIQELSKLFAANVGISILDEENVYPKVQAAIILEKFFSQNKPKTVTMLHKITSNPNYNLGVLIVNTDKGPYRIAYTLKATDGNLALIEMRIEKEKVK